MTSFSPSRVSASFLLLDVSAASVRHRFEGVSRIDEPLREMVRVRGIVVVVLIKRRWCK